MDKTAMPIRVNLVADRTKKDNMRRGKKRERQLYSTEKRSAVDWYVGEGQC